MDDALRFADFEFEDRAAQQQNQRIERLEERIADLERRAARLSNTTTCNPTSTTTRHPPSTSAENRIGAEKRQ